MPPKQDSSSLTGACRPALLSQRRRCLAGPRPLFLLWLELPVWSVSLSRVCAEGVVGLVGCALVFNRRMSIEPRWSMLWETFNALKDGLAAPLPVCSETVLMQKSVDDAAKAIGDTRRFSRSGTWLRSSSCRSAGSASRFLWDSCRAQRSRVALVVTARPWSSCCTASGWRHC